MKYLILTAIFAFSSAAYSRSCKVELYGPYGELITSVRTGNDGECMKAVGACRNWAVWYVAPTGSRCIRVADDGYAAIDYIRYPDYDNYYGYRGSPYSSTPRTRPSTNEVCVNYSDGSRHCRPVQETRPTPRPETRPYPRPTPRPETRPYPTPTPRPETRPTPTPRPETRPTPTPVPVPLPAPTPGADSIRAIEAGETVIFNSAFHMVVSVESPNFYTLKLQNGRNRDTIKDVARNYVAVTRGCNAGFCANDSVIVLASASYAAIAGIEYDGQFVLKTIDGNDQLTFDVNPNTLAWTKGCSPEATTKACIGNVVMRQENNVYYTVVGIQLDGNIVLESNDAPKKLTINVRPNSLLITR